MSEEKEEKCRKCGKRPATDDDGLCDHCRTMEMLNAMIESRES